MNAAASSFALIAEPLDTTLTYFPCPRCEGHGCLLIEGETGARVAQICPRCRGDKMLGATPDQVEEANAIGSDNPFCPHEWSYSGTAYGGEDESYHGEGTCRCSLCGADGDA